MSILFYRSNILKSMPIGYKFLNTYYPTTYDLLFYFGRRILIVNLLAKRRISSKIDAFFFLFCFLFILHS